LERQDIWGAASAERVWGKSQQMRVRISNIYDKHGEERQNNAEKVRLGSTEDAKLAVTGSIIHFLSNEE
jgi:hypothetical protein